MRARYPDCVRKDNNCARCSLVSYGRDCHNNPIHPLLWARLNAELTQRGLAEKSGVSIKTIQKIEAGSADIGNLTANNLLALAEALETPPRALVPRRPEART